MVAMLAFGGSFAYFTASADEAKTSVKTGKVQLTANSVATLVEENVVSGMQLVKSGNVSVTSASNVDTWVFVTFAVTFTDSTGATKTPVTQATMGEETFWLDYSVKDGWTELKDYKGVYGKQFTGSADAKTEVVCDSIKFYANSNSTTSALGSLMDGSIEVKISSESIQDWSEGDTPAPFATADAAYAALHPGN